MSSSRYDAILNDQVNPWPTDDVDEAGYDQAHPSSEVQPEHPCLALKKLLSSGTFFYSADFDLQAESARLVFSGELPVERLISHRVPLNDIEHGIAIALRPTEESLKVVVHPQEPN